MALAQYRLADRLHKTFDEIEQMSFAEFNGWMAYFRILKSEERK